MIVVFVVIVIAVVLVVIVVVVVVIAVGPNSDSIFFLLRPAGLSGLLFPFGLAEFFFDGPIVVSVMLGASLGNAGPGS